MSSTSHKHFQAKSVHIRGTTAQKRGVIINDARKAPFYTTLKLKPSLVVSRLGGLCYKGQHRRRGQACAGQLGKDATVRQLPFNDKTVEAMILVVVGSQVKPCQSINYSEPPLRLNRPISCLLWKLDSNESCWIERILKKAKSCSAASSKTRERPSRSSTDKTNSRAFCRRSFCEDNGRLWLPAHR